MAFISHSQNLEDVMLWRALRHVDVGFFIDAGAWDPVEDSVTLAFYERGWRGINIEPNLDKHRALVAARPGDVNLALALSDAPGFAAFHEVPGTGLSTLDPALAASHAAAGAAVVLRTVPVSTLRDVCAAHAPGPIHFLKVDVEGAEPAVLAGMDFGRFRPWIVVVEATEPNSQRPSHAAWEPGLLAASYRLAYFDGLNRFYLAEEQAAALRPAFDSPPNVFDDYVSSPGLRRALAMEVDGRTMPPLDELLQARDAAGAAMARQAVAAAERRALAAERDAALAQADAEHRRAAPPPVDAAPPAGPPVPGRPRVFYDASLILRFGLETPVGLVRAEHYVAEVLARDPGLDLRFVTFAPADGCYRALTRAEAALIRRVLFHRYNQAGPAPLPEEAEAAPLAQVPDLAAAGPAPEPAAPRPLLRRAGTAARIGGADFAIIARRDALRLLPVAPRHGFGRRLATHAARLALLRVGEAGHAVVHGAYSAATGAWDAARHAVRPDAEPEPAVPAPEVLPEPAVPEPTVPEPEPPEPEPPEPPPGAVRFAAGDALLSLGNLWDYMDYAYLFRLVRRDGVRFVSVIFDVIAMEHPHTTPGPPHVYHRHWVELGHVAAHLLAISRHSAAQYRALVAEPNGLSPPLSHAHLPSVLQARAAEIGEQPVPALLGRSFVVYCSTIETRKNHALLLQLWDRLRSEFAADRLPVLVFVGKWGWGTEAVRLLAERNHRLRPHLLILDTASDAELIWLYRHARFSVFPAIAEGYGLAAAESLSFGTPVVVADCPALVEASGGLMPALDPLDFAAWMQQMRALIGDDDRLRTLREAAARFEPPPFAAFADALRAALVVPPAGSA